ncbi:UPF0481 protein [Trifolium repens]|nr:UPF0481 protein [Trifolium repens]
MEEELDTLMDKRLSQLKEAQQKFAQKNQISIPKIQRAPKFLRQNKRFAKYYSPKIISFGPIHHNSESLEEGEHYKLLWTSLFVAEYGEKIEKDDNQACQLLLKKIEDNIDELKNMFTEDAIEGYNDNDLAWILFVDGCSLLHFMENIDEQCPEALNLKFDRMMFMFRDVILLENQLPSKMLDILCKEKGLNLEYCYSNYHHMGECKRLGKVLIPLGYPIPFHILDSWHSVYLVSHNIEGQNQIVVENTILSDGVCNEELDFNWNTYKSIQDLKKVGIQVMANEKDEWIWRTTTTYIFVQ